MYRFAAYDLFGDMRHSTPAEQKEYERMLNKHSISFGKDVLKMPDIENGYCDLCHQHKQLQRKYYHYPVNCECCGGTTHFEIVKYCEDCIPHPPEGIHAQVKPIQKDTKIHPEHWDYYA